MTELSIAGGVYHERCEWPTWDMVFGSGGRAAAAISSVVDKVRLNSYASEDAARRFSSTVRLYEFDFQYTPILRQLSFDYIHPLAMPIIRPSFGTIGQNAPIEVN